MDWRPPLPVSPRRLRPRRPPPGSYAPPSSRLAPPPASSKKPQPRNRSSAPLESPVRPEVSSELMALAKSFGSGDGVVAAAANNASPAAGNGSPLFERGRFYELYSARRNERLKRRILEESWEETVAQDPGVAVELAKRRSSKKAEGAKKSVPADFSVSRASGLQSSRARASKEMKKPAAAGASERCGGGGGGRRVGTPLVRRL